MSTTSKAHPTTSLAFALDSKPPDTRVGNVTFDAGARSVFITMEQGSGHLNSLLSFETHGWRYSLDGITSFSWCLHPFLLNSKLWAL